MTEFNVGQTLYYVPERGNNRLITIEKVGRVWMTSSNLGRMRINKKTLCIDGGEYASPGKCWISESDYHQHNELSSAWQDLRYRMENYRYTLPDEITVDKIRQAVSLLFGQ